ncbi:fluoride efflux transporter CrcB [Oceanimonas baumannii]|uniref:Fluoride-specific ion channel FluC n=1 Tax=Oceanimonas baumannii TaxID=129578 RepID=A0A235CHU1_9GAMM|nr:fluoride efflux transporter CrcB [Oceanimonas baumannii]OYD23415.1 camphor resistance protein CrcB [Oceanimonas baumannii]TDW58429.1 CrcB protein [Oceanimonas baumannii]
MKTLLFIALGGATGAVLRFVITDLMGRLLGRSFPFGILTVNLIGSLLMGVIFILVQQQVLSAHSWRPFIMVGMLGALTTFSSFSLDTVLLLEHGQWFKAGLNVCLNVVCCMIFTFLGMQITQSLLASR